MLEICRPRECASPEIMDFQPWFKSFLGVGGMNALLTSRRKLDGKYVLASKGISSRGLGARPMAAVDHRLHSILFAGPKRRSSLRALDVR